ncbi:epoxide hydrolase [Kribbella sandramycini]|uniref:Epoxide hydrolase n=1 Tax=Kribbella sandramycini TaxID=60450 RepID=A0A7Y4L7G9_9ACTN|nr:epoxide hydrolase family protein [Kribbella sandramycini]MBB6570257.1 pimeloyl-ACP methyl ester carboxylesterase [Kribbella sandramycini]NOL45825.1 epoxide hydrolase [Kribbella sandramycini]
MDPFRIAVPDDVLDELRARLRRTRFATPTAPGWQAGVDPAYLRSLVSYWAEEFDWRRAEARLNGYPQYVEAGTHFVHLERDPSRPPVLLTHGWPSAFTELLPLAELLDVDVVIATLPGFLWSEAAEGPTTRAAIADRFHRLMTDTLGYDRYFAFGGDIGGSVCGWLATQYPEHVAGVHVVHGPFPAEYAEPITAAEQVWLDSDDERGEADGGYQAIIGTSPDTVASALLDSPAGLAAFIIEKLRVWSDCGGDLESRFDRDTLCTLLTLYWVTDSIGTSFRPYFDGPHNKPRPTITVPVAVTQSQEWNMPLFPRSIAERAASDIRRYLAPERGGHFMAFEEPELVAAELTAFMAGIGQ